MFSLIPIVFALHKISDCDETVWPAFYSAAHAPHHPTGWKARPGSSESLTLRKRTALLYTICVKLNSFL